MRIKRRTYLQTCESDYENAIGNVTNAISKRNEIATPDRRQIKELLNYLEL